MSDHAASENSATASRSAGAAAQRGRSRRAGGGKPGPKPKYADAEARRVADLARRAVRHAQRTPEERAARSARAHAAYTQHIAAAPPEERAAHNAARSAAAAQGRGAAERSARRDRARANADPQAAYTVTSRRLATARDALSAARSAAEEAMQAHGPNAARDVYATQSRVQRAQRAYAQALDAQRAAWDAYRASANASANARVSPEQALLAAFGLRAASPEALAARLGLGARAGGAADAQVRADPHAGTLTLHAQTGGAIQRDLAITFTAGGGRGPAAPHARVDEFALHPASGGAATYRATAQSLAQTLTALRAVGVSRVSATAPRGPFSNAYFAWARVGANGAIPPSVRAAAQAQFGRDVTTVQELMQRSGGDVWWAQHGATFDATFTWDNHTRSLLRSALNG